MKTADEMFRELGYEKELLNKGVYINKKRIRIMIDSRFGSIIKFREIPMNLTFAEALACAQLIREMGCDCGK